MSDVNGDMINPKVVLALAQAMQKKGKKVN